MKINSKNKQEESKEIPLETDEQRREQEDPSAVNLPSTYDSLESEILEGKKAFEELNDQYLRLAADFDNYKKRVSKERADLISYANEELIKSLLSVLDNLERGIEHSETNAETNPIIKGFKLVHKQFLDCLEKFGVRVINVSKGDEFDPNLHQAVERVESDAIQPGLVISEMLKGYMLKDRLLRPSLVTVSKGQAGDASGIESAGDQIEIITSDGDENGKTNLINGDR